ncbi:protein C10-like [Acanthaster planci]|uniref:Protein C10 n=1 Tax=Acanthaster planci TaxID=133434 RepID=A0A8B7XTL1_ACAPL|nr:protein C10-like [Acanthaster planci]
MAQDTQSRLSLEDAKAVLQKVLEAFLTPENKTRMEEVKDAAGNDMMKMMQVVFPVATQIQMEVIQKYGFSADGEGAVKFAQLIRHYETMDSTVADLSAQLKAIFLPPLPPPVPTQSQASVASSS